MSALTQAFGVPPKMARELALPSLPRKRDPGHPVEPWGSGLPHSRAFAGMTHDNLPGLRGSFRVRLFMGGAEGCCPRRTRTKIRRADLPSQQTGAAPERCPVHWPAGNIGG